ncbi:MAG: hypothetical protein IKM49_03280 [Ruminococcus sp.]|nr:hypothetical protein [Ruminococcus sp.]MBR6792125.1 hypothetical protein [Ruminococcus sp.]
MNFEAVKALFALFTGLEDTEKYLPILNFAVRETTDMLASPKYASDSRIEFLCASVANYRFAQIESARGYTQSTYAGNISAVKKDSGALKYACDLVKDYMTVCRSLLKTSDFVFISSDTQAYDAEEV